MAKVGRKAHVLKTNINIFLSTGEFIEDSTLNKDVEKAKMEVVNKDGHLEVVVKKEKYYLPATTVEYMKGSSAMVLSDVTCVHCKNKILMSSKAATERILEICPVCFKHMYDRNNKKPIRRW